MSVWVYIRSQPGLFTVGHYSPDGEWHTDSDHRDSEKAAERCHWLNGGGGKAENRPRTYFKVTCAREEEMAGAGLGYEEIFGDRFRYFWCEGDATRACAALEHAATDDLRGTYAVQARHVCADGSYDDEYDEYAASQLGLI